MYFVNEIFTSLQGEGYWTGTPMVFLRFAGCNLRCPFCDTAHTSPSTPMSLDELLKAVAEISPLQVEMTTFAGYASPAVSRACRWTRRS